MGMVYVCLFTMLSSNSKEVWVALDAMGGDFAPSEIVKGAVLGAAKGNNVILVGDEPSIRKELGESFGERLRIHHAPQIIKMDDSPVRALKEKPQNSITSALELTRDKKAHVFISAGNSGALMVASKWTLGDIPGIFRPAIAVPIPTPKGEGVMLDGGSSTDCSPENLFQFAVMGHHYARRILKIDKPRIALLNIGGEKSKGNLEVQKAYEFLSSSELNFTGNIEGDELFSGKVDVIICDGFVGNIVLKVAEGTARKMLNTIKDSVEQGGFVERLGSMLLRKIFRSIKKQMDWMEYGGAVIMGVEGNVIITHGKSTASSIANAIAFATRVATADLAGIISEEIRNSMMRSTPTMGSNNNNSGGS